MYCILIAIIIRLAIGTAFALLGLVISIILNNWIVFNDLFVVIGFIIMVIGILPIVGIMEYGNRRNTKDRINDEDSSISFGLTMLLIGIPSVILPVIFYYLAHVKF